MTAIEDARAFLEPWGADPDENVPRAVRVVRALIAEHERLTASPADDEREAAALHLWDEGLVRPESLAFSVVDALIAEGYFRRQGPITDAQVDAAARSNYRFQNRACVHFVPDWADIPESDPFKGAYRAEARESLEAARDAS